MNHELLSGEKVRLQALEPKRDAGLLSRWSENAEFMRNLDADPIRLFSPQAMQKWLEDQTDREQPNMIIFLIRTLKDDRPIGFIDLFGMYGLTGDAMIGIGIGEPQNWGQGFGTDAMRVVVRYGFSVLNLHRMSLNVFVYNPRGIRAYEKAGFKIEGRLREALHRDGQRWDLIFMGILRDEWVNSRLQENLGGE